MIKYMILYSLILPFFSNVTDVMIVDSLVDKSIDFNELIADSDVVVLVEAMNTESIENGRIIEQYQYFKAKEVLTGSSQPIIRMKTQSVFQGDIVHELKAHRSFEEGETYLLFLHEEADNYEFSNDAVFEEINSNGKSYFIGYRASQLSEDTLDGKNIYEKEALMEAIKSFHYNEVEIINSEIIRE